MKGAAAEFAVALSDYRSVEGGLRFPFSMAATFDGQPVYTSRLESVRINPAFAPMLFDPPAPHPAPAR